MRLSEKIKSPSFLAGVLAIIGLAILSLGIYEHFFGASDTKLKIFCFSVSPAVWIVAWILHSGRWTVKRVKFGNFEIDTEELNQPNVPPAQVKSGELEPEERQKRQEYALNKELPDRRVQDEFDAVEASRSVELILASTNWNYPAYILDGNYRVVDWNIAFSLVFDNTLEGRRGHSIQEWVYRLDNYQEVLDNAERDFADPDNLPYTHVEPIVYLSPRYGHLNASKHAVRINDSAGKPAGWLVMLQPEFNSIETEERFHSELIYFIGQELMWTEYALSYDKILAHAEIYTEQMRLLCGDDAPLTRIPDGAKILDLGAGTGNLTRYLAETRRSSQVIAVDNNMAMLDILKKKCQAYMMSGSDQAGVAAVKQQIESLYGFGNETFDYVIMTNVLYAVEDKEDCLKEVNRVLKRGGEIRLTGPKKNTNIDTVLGYIQSSLVAKNKFESYREDFIRVAQINKLRLSLILNEMTVDAAIDLLAECGFEQLIHNGPEIYKGESMFLVAAKP